MNQKKKSKKKSVFGFAAQMPKSETVQEQEQVNQNTEAEQVNEQVKRNCKNEQVPETLNQTTKQEELTDSNKLNTETEQLNVTEKRNTNKEQENSSVNTKSEVEQENENVNNNNKQIQLNEQDKGFLEQFQAIVKKPTIEETHKRQTFLIDKRLLKRLDRIAKRQPKGFKTHFLNYALEKALDELEKK